MNQAEKFMALINSTPGVVSDRMFQAAGIKWPYNVRAYYALPVVRVIGLGYRRAA